MIFFLYFLLLFTYTTAWGAGAAGYNPETGKVDKEESVDDGGVDRSSTPPPRTTASTTFHAEHSPFQILQATPPRARHGHVKSKTHDDGEHDTKDVARKLFTDTTTQTSSPSDQGLPPILNRRYSDLSELTTTLASPAGASTEAHTPDSLVVSLQNLFHHIQENITPISQDTIDEAQIMKKDLPADMQKYLDEHTKENIILELPYKHLFEPYFIKDSREIFGFHHDHNHEVENKAKKYLTFTEKKMYKKYYTTNITYTPNVTVDKKTYTRTTPDTPGSIAAAPLSTATASPTQEVAHVLFPEPSPTEEFAHVLFPEASTPHKMYTEGSLKGFFPAGWTRKKLLEELKNFLHHAVHDTILDTDDSMHFSHQVSDDILIKIVFVKEDTTWRIGTIFPILYHVHNKKIESARKQEDIKAIAQAAKESKIKQIEEKELKKRALQESLRDPKQQMRRLNKELQNKQTDLLALLTGTQIHKEKEIQSLEEDITALTKEIATLKEKIAPIEQQIKALELIDLENHARNLGTRLTQKEARLAELRRGLANEEEGFEDEAAISREIAEREIAELESQIPLLRNKTLAARRAHIAAAKAASRTDDTEGDDTSESASAAAKLTPTRRLSFGSPDKDGTSGSGWGGRASAATAAAKDFERGDDGSDYITNSDDDDAPSKDPHAKEGETNKEVRERKAANARSRERTAGSKKPGDTLESAAAAAAAAPISTEDKHTKRRRRKSSSAKRASDEEQEYGGGKEAEPDDE